MLADPAPFPCVGHTTSSPEVGRAAGRALFVLNSARPVDHRNHGTDRSAATWLSAADGTKMPSMRGRAVSSVLSALGLTPRAGAPLPAGPGAVRAARCSAWPRRCGGRPRSWTRELGDAARARHRHHPRGPHPRAPAVRRDRALDQPRGRRPPPARTTGCWTWRPPSSSSPPPATRPGPGEVERRAAARRRAQLGRQRRSSCSPRSSRRPPATCSGCGPTPGGCRASRRWPRWSPRPWPRAAGPGRSTRSGRCRRRRTRCAPGPRPASRCG